MANFFSCFTFIEPITEPIEDDALLASRHQTNGAVVHPGAIVDVVLENEDLQEPEREEVDFNHILERPNNRQTEKKTTIRASFQAAPILQNTGSLPALRTLICS